MPQKSVTKIDGKKLMADLTKGFKTKPTKRGGKSGFMLVQHDGRTLAMASIKGTGAVRLEGSRLDKNLTIIDSKGVALGRKAMEKVRDENASKARPKPKAKSDERTNATRAAARMSAVASSDPRGDEPQPSGRRARSRSRRAQPVA